jgi:large subunit ribosomal protein L10
MLAGQEFVSLRYEAQIFTSMAKTRQQKEEELSALREKFSRSKGVAFTRYMGLTVADLQDLRRKLRAEENELVVAKKSLLGIMVSEAGLSKDEVNNMSGDIAVVFGYKDEVAPAKILADFAKTHPVVEFHGGVLEGKFIDRPQVEALSKLPSRLELLAKMVGSMKSPISGMVNVLSGNMRGLVQVLAQVKEQKEKTA